jgi:hypothetical protein
MAAENRVFVGRPQIRVRGEENPNDPLARRVQRWQEDDEEQEQVN